MGETNMLGHPSPAQVVHPEPELSPAPDAKEAMPPQSALPSNTSSAASASMPSPSGPLSWAERAAAAKHSAPKAAAQPSVLRDIRRTGQPSAKGSGPADRPGDKDPGKLSETAAEGYTASSSSNGPAPRAQEGVKLWVSGLPTEDARADVRGNPVTAKEVLTTLNTVLRDHAPHIHGEVTEIDWKDDRKPFAFAQVSNERTAKELVILSKQKKVYLRGDRLILDLSNYNTTPVRDLHPSGPSWSYEDPDRPRGKGRGRGKDHRAQDRTMDSNWRSRGGSTWKGSDSRR